MIISIIFSSVKSEQIELFELMLCYDALGNFFGEYCLIHGSRFQTAHTTLRENRKKKDTYERHAMLFVRSLMTTNS